MIDKPFAFRLKRAGFHHNLHFFLAYIPKKHYLCGLKCKKVWIDYQQMPYYQLPDKVAMWRRKI